MDELIEDAVEIYGAQICEEVCKHRETWQGEQDEFVDEVCADCPVTKLMEILKDEAPMGFNPYQE